MLAKQLNEQVSEMVLSKKVCPGSAQEIARLPKEVQFKFATHAYERDMTKSSVELLVVTYNNRGTSQSLKNAIIHQPDAILHTLIPQKVIQTIRQDTPDDGFKKFNGSLRLLLSLLSEVEIYLAGMSKEKLFQHQRFLPIIQKACSQFQNLVSYHIDSLGKLYDSETYREVISLATIDINTYKFICRLHAVEKLSQRQIAQKLGVSRNTIRKYCLGATHPDQKNAYHIEKSPLRVTLEEEILEMINTHKCASRKQQLNGKII